MKLKEQSTRYMTGGAVHKGYDSGGAVHMGVEHRRSGPSTRVTTQEGQFT